MLPFLFYLLLFLIVILTLVGMAKSTLYQLLLMIFPPKLTCNAACSVIIPCGDCIQTTGSLNIFVP